MSASRRERFAQALVLGLVTLCAFTLVFAVVWDVSSGEYRSAFKTVSHAISGALFSYGMRRAARA